MISVQCKYCLRMCDIAVDLYQIKEWIERGDFIQDFFPDLSAADREVLISQTCDACWQKMFDASEDDVDEEA